MADPLLRALLRGRTLRVVAVSLGELAGEVAARHQVQGQLAVALGRAAASALLLAVTSAKDDQRVTLHVMGDGPVRAITADALAWGGVRVYASIDGELPPAGATARSLAGLVGKGHVGVVRDLGLRERYKGEAAITSGEIDEDVEHYLRISEQIDSALGADVLLDAEGRPRGGAALLLQALPGADDDARDAIAALRERLRAGALAAYLATASAPLELTALITALLPEEPLDTLEPSEARFYCPCTRERVRTTLKMLGETELLDMIREGRPAEVICNFCRERYEVDVAELAELLDAKGRN